MRIYKFFKVLFMFIKHGINPFAKYCSNKDKIIKRFTEDEKKWLIDNSKGIEREYIAKKLDMEWYTWE